MGKATIQSPLCWEQAAYSVPGVGQKIKCKEIKLEWFLIRLVLSRKTVVQQDSVEALHDNRNTLEKKDHLSVIARGRRDPPTKVT